MNYLYLYYIIIHLLLVLHFELNLANFFLDPLGYLSACVSLPDGPRKATCYPKELAFPCLVGCSGSVRLLSKHALPKRVALVSYHKVRGFLRVQVYLQVFVSLTQRNPYCQLKVNL